MSRIINAFKNFRLQGANMEIFRFAFYVSFPLGVMLYVGNDTHDKLNIKDFWPDPSRLNNPPKDPAERRAEIERLRVQRIERRKTLEERARELGVDTGSSKE